MPGRAPRQTDAVSPDDRRPVSLDTVPAAEPEKARPENDANERGSSTLWRSYIWESLPTENLNGPDPDPVSEAYQKNDWKPIFIDSQFGLNQGAELLLARLRTLENEAIDPRPFRLDELSQSLEKLDQCRSALRAADPEIKDSRAESFSDARPSALAADRVHRTGSATEATPGDSEKIPGNLPGSQRSRYPAHHRFLSLRKGNESLFTEGREPKGPFGRDSHFEVFQGT